MPFYQFASDKRLTDAAWMKLLDSKDHPTQPAWMKFHEQPPAVQDRRQPDR